MSADNLITPDDQTAEFLAFFSLHERRIKCYILALVTNWQDAEEVTAETNARLWQQFGEYDRSKDFGSWACTIAYYQVLTFRKRQARARQRLSIEAIEALAQETSQRSEQEERRFAALEVCLDKVSPDGRDLLERCYGGAKSMRETAAELGRTVHSVYSWLARIRLQLHECIEARLHGGGE